MSKIWIIAKNEYEQVVKKKSFIVGLLLTPAIMAAFIFLPMLIGDKKASRTESMAVVDFSNASIGQEIVDKLATYRLPDDSTAPYYRIDLLAIPAEQTGMTSVILDSINKQVNDDQLKYALVIKDNSLTDTSIYAITNSDDFVSLNRFENIISEQFAARRLNLSNVNLPVDSIMHLTERVDLSLMNTQGKEVSIKFKYFSMLLFVMTMYGMILGYGMQVMRSVIEEKTTRIMEVLVSSVTPFQLLMGKVLGLGGATFTSVIAWMLMGSIFMGGASIFAMELDPAMTASFFNPVMAIAFGLFLVSGYLLYSTMYAVIGAICTTEKEAQNFHFPIIMALLLPVFIGFRAMQDPNATLPLVLSFIPFFTPTMMMMRVSFLAPSAGEFSLFSPIMLQVYVGFILVIATTIGVIWVAGKIFRVGILMYGKRATLAEVIKWIRY